MGGNPITKQVALRALRKLEAKEAKGGGAHPKYVIYNGNKVVAETGLRHSPNPDIPVPHIKGDLRVNAQFVLDLARCPKSKNDWLRAIGETPVE